VQKLSNRQTSKKTVEGKQRMSAASRPKTLFEKIWSKHRILEREDEQELMFVDTHMLQDGSAPAFEMLRQRWFRAFTDNIRFYGWSSW
jgi:homoaconitase/3-isopropylmalate dehydratase large subunit